MGYYAGIDVGGTKIYSVIIDDDGKILARAKIKVGENLAFDVVLGRIFECYQQACQTANIAETAIQAVGFAVPSSVDLERGVVKHAPNLGWKNIQIRDILREKLHKPFFVENDVNLGTFAEYHFGAGKGYRSIYGVFVGTGVGGGYVLDGNMVSGVNYIAGEVGHIIIKMNGPRCGCGNRGCLESIGSKTGMIRYMKKQIDKRHKESLLEKFEPNWRKSLGSSALRKAYEKQDAVATKAMQRAAAAIGVAAANIIMLTGVDAIILGGGVIEELHDFFMPLIEKSMQENTYGDGANGVALLQSPLGDDAVALGAAWLVRLPEKQAMLW